MVRPVRHAWPLALLGLSAAASIVAALSIGSVAVAPEDVLSALTGRSPAGTNDVVLALRLPRALTGFAVGGLLALSGALLQALLRNPLADPYVLGVSGGAAVAALLALALGFGLAGVQLAAIAGALLTMALLFALARRALFSDQLMDSGRSGTVLLTGVMLASLAAASMSLILSLAPDGRLRTMMFWLLGDLSAATDLGAALVALPLLVLLVVLATLHGRALNLVLRGDLQAFSQGVRVAATRRRLILIASVATAAAVSLAGPVGFVGFVAPHLVRMTLGNDQRLLLPAATVLGGTLVVLADTAARTAFAPLQLPVGVVTALLGVPAFLWLLGRR